MTKTGTVAPPWKQHSDKRGADFRIIRPGEGEGPKVNDHAFLESLEDRWPLPSPLRWAVSMGSQLAIIEWERQDRRRWRVVEYKFILQSLESDTRSVI